MTILWENIIITFVGLGVFVYLIYLIYLSVLLVKYLKRRKN